MGPGVTRPVVSLQRGRLRPRQEAVGGEKQPLQGEGSGCAGGPSEVVSGLQVVTEGRPARPAGD